MSTGTVVKLSALRFAPYALPLRAPFRTARETLQVRRGWVLRIEDDQGAWGMGEAAPLAGFGTESHEQVGAALTAFARVLPGREVTPALGAEPEPPPAFGLGLLHPAGAATLHGLELALLDLAARKAGLPLARHLCSGAASQVTVNAVLSADTAEAGAAQARSLAAQGYGTLKIKVGAEEAEADLERLRGIRTAVGGGVRLRVDANGSWTEPQALRFLEAAAELDIEYVEQPLAAHDLEGMARLARHSPVAIAADEAVLSHADARGVLDKRAAHVLVLKPMALGGVLTALAVARMAAGHGVKSVITTMLDGAYARAGAVHAAAALAGLTPASTGHAHGLATGALLEGDLADAPLAPQDGRIDLTDAAGLGCGEPEHKALPGLAG